MRTRKYSPHAPKALLSKTRRLHLLAFTLLPSAFLLGNSLAQAETRVFVQNNTPHLFTVDSSQTGAALDRGRWRQLVTVVEPAARTEVIRFNRDEGIRKHKIFVFLTRLNLTIKAIGRDSSAHGMIQLRQQLRGSDVNSHMWQSLAGSGFEDPWFDDRQTHRASWNVAGHNIEIKYRAFFTGTDDNVEYVLNELHPVPAGDSDTLNILTYNLYMRPPPFLNGQLIRAQLLPERLHGYDVIVFQEAFDYLPRRILLQRLAMEYPYQTNVVGSNRQSVVQSNGGVVIVSRWPIEGTPSYYVYKACHGIDCRAAKGVIYARIIKEGKRHYHIFGTHMQADDNGSARRERSKQFKELKDFIHSKSISQFEPVLIAGDLNVNSVKDQAEYQLMLDKLDAGHPVRVPTVGFPFSHDGKTNSLADGDRSNLDYVLYSKKHLRPIDSPSDSYNEVRIIRSNEEWKELGFEHAYWDLSDHYPVLGHYRFQFVPSTVGAVTSAPVMPQSSPTSHKLAKPLPKKVQPRPTLMPAAPTGKHGQH